MAEKVGVRESIKTNERFDELYQQLNSEQRSAVDAIEGPVMVLAGPGTGKTQVLAMRIANILRITQMDPWNILCLTFTESAAAAMRQRLIEIIGETAYYVRISTFHSFCNDIIQEYPEKFVLASSMQVLSEVERVEILRELIDALPGSSPLKPFGHTYLYVSDIVQAIGWLKKEGVTEQELRDLITANQDWLTATDDTLSDFFDLSASGRTDADCERILEAVRQTTDELKLSDTLWPYFGAMFVRYAEGAASAEGKREQGKARTKLKNDLRKVVDGMRRQLPRQRELLKVYRGYQRKLQALGRYDFDDMIMQVLEQLKKDDDLLASVQEMWQYILVDEYQDTNGAQNEVVRLLGSYYPNPNVFVVGDDKQSIFRFQGASLENLLSFFEDYIKHVQVFSLKDNYRSGQTVLDAAMAVINHNTATVTKAIPGLSAELTAVTTKYSSVARYEFDSVDEENYFVAKKIKNLLSDGVNPQQIAVLYRFNRDAASLLDIMLRMELPVHAAVGENVLDDRRVRQLLRLMQYVADEKRDDTLAEIVQYDFWGLEPLATLKVIHFAGHRRLPLLSVLTSADSLSEAGVTNAKPFVALVERLSQWRVVAANDTLQQLFDEVLQGSGLLQRILDDPRQLLILHHITAVFSELRRLNSVDSHLTVGEFIRRMHLLEEHGLSLVAEPWQTKAEAVQLMSAHRAKGLEFDHVFLIRLVDKHWGNIRERSRLKLPLGIVHHDPIMGQTNNEDERRLFFVALTRAKQQLYLSHAKLEGNSNREQVSSLFVREIPKELLNDNNTIETEDEALKRLTKVRLSTPQTPSAPDVREWLEERLKTYAMSVTHLNNYLDCPRLFYYRNLLRVPAAKSKHMALGTAVHNALRDVFVGINEKKLTPPVEYLVDQFQFYLDRETLSDNDRKGSLELGKEALRQYYKHYAESFASSSLLEYDFRPQGVHLGDLLIVGKLDKIEILNADKKLVNVVDYKTGNPDNAGKHMREGGKYRRQLVFYKLLCDSAPRFDFKMVSAELDFIQPSARTGKFVKKKFKITSTEVEDLQKTIRRVWKEIQALKFLEEDAACGECEYCQKD